MMKKNMFFFSLIFFIGCVSTNNSIFIPEGNTISEIPIISVRLPTPEEEANIILDQIRNISYLKTIGINGTLPNYPIVKEINRKYHNLYERITPSDFIELQDYLRNNFNPIKYERALRIVNDVLLTINDQTFIFKYYNEKWGFHIPENGYEIILTNYLIGDGFAHGDKIWFNITSIINNPRLKTHSIILHELFHVGYMGAPDTVRISHNQNEWITDQFVIDHFPQLRWRHQQNSDSSVRAIFRNQNKQDVWNDLPNRLEPFRVYRGDTQIRPLINW